MRNEVDRIRVSWLFAAIVSTAGAQAVHADATSVAAEQKVRSGVQQLLLELASRGELVDADGLPMALDISEPSRDVDNLGVVIDGTPSSNGVSVVAVTPGGAAAKMGIRSGDRLVSAQDRSLVRSDTGTSTVATLREAVASVGDGGTLRLGVDRDGRRIDFSGPLQRLRLPAIHLRLGDGSQAMPQPAMADRAGCGRISTFDIAQRQQNLHPAQLIAIDGKAAGPHGSSSFRLPAGRHVLTVAEEIDARYLSFNDRQRNRKEIRYKTLAVDVQADTTYHLAARLDPAKSSDWKDGAYWEPTLWLEKTERCTP